MFVGFSFAGSGNCRAKAPRSKEDLLIKELLEQGRVGTLHATDETKRLCIGRRIGSEPD